VQPFAKQLCPLVPIVSYRPRRSIRQRVEAVTPPRPSRSLRGRPSRTAGRRAGLTRQRAAPERGRSPCLSSHVTECPSQKVPPERDLGHSRLSRHEHVDGTNRLAVSDFLLVFYSDLGSRRSRCRVKRPSRRAGRRAGFTRQRAAPERGGV